MKIFLWRLAFELKNLQRAVAPSKDTVQYFAFGGNLDPKVLLRRKIKPVAEKPIVLKDYQMRFTHPGAFEGMGFASIEPAPGKVTYGKLYTLTQTDADRMDYYELVPFLNRYKRVSVNQDGEEFFFYQSAVPRQGLKPTKKYVQMILDGFHKVDHVPESFLAELKSIETIDKLIPAKKLEFRVKNLDRWPASLVPFLQKYDQTAIKLFIKYVKDRSLTGRSRNAHY